MEVEEEEEEEEEAKPEDNCSGKPDANKLTRHHQTRGKRGTKARGTGDSPGPHR
jgi:hypothetical protein